jgi:glucosylceramidase
MNKRSLLFLVSIGFFTATQAQVGSVEWVSTTRDVAWKQTRAYAVEKDDTGYTLVVDTARRLQAIRGFGACFNELGWAALRGLPGVAKDSIFRELFSPGTGANFTLCRMPVGANDFSRDWYSYDETPGDFTLSHFSIANDRQTIVPFIRYAKRYNPGLELWASPWSPPAWMKANDHYGCAASGPGTPDAFRNGLAASAQGSEGNNLFIQKEAYLKAYAAYFSRFIQAYRKEGISIGMVMPQNEFNSCQVFPSCTWTAGALARFVGDYLGPAMHRMGVAVFFGTMERANASLVDTILNDPAAGKYVRGVGFQWAGKGAIETVHRDHPRLTLYQSEQECGDGANDWAFACYTWTLMRHYFSGGASAYMYWNLALPSGGQSRWGWRQNSLVSVDTLTGAWHYNPDYYVFKHLSHFVQPGARMLVVDGTLKEALAFRNPDGSVVVVAANLENIPRRLSLRIGRRRFSAVLPPSSIHTFNLKP